MSKPVASLSKKVATHVRRVVHDPDLLERVAAAAWLRFRNWPVSEEAITLAETLEHELGKR